MKAAGVFLSCIGNGGVTRSVPARVLHELLVVVKESFANVANMIKACSVTLQLPVMDGELHLTLRNDGYGVYSA